MSPRDPLTAAGAREDDRMTLPIPDELLPAPRLVVWHHERGRRDQDERDALRNLRRAYASALRSCWVQHGMLVEDGRVAHGTGWSGWHIPDAEAIAGMATIARVIAPEHWTIMEESGAGG